MIPDRPGLSRLMLVTDRRLVRGGDLRAAVARAVEGGVGLVQVRERDLPDAELAVLVEELRETIGSGAKILLNGKPELARALGVGLHLPAGAAPAGELAPRPRGRSAHDLDEVRRAVEESSDYVLLGTIYRTRSKPGRAAVGPDLVREAASRFEGVPLFAIGGVLVRRVPEVVRAGAYGIAACRAFLRAPDPRRVAQAMTLALSLGSP